VPPPMAPQPVAKQAAPDEAPSASIKAQNARNNASSAETQDSATENRKVKLVLLTMLVLWVLVLLANVRRTALARSTASEFLLQVLRTAQLAFGATGKPVSVSSAAASLPEDKQSGLAKSEPRLFGYRTADLIKWASLPLLVLQNSSLFLVMKYSRSMHADVYHPTVTVFVTELVKFVIALTMVLVNEREQGVFAALRKLVSQRQLLLVLAVPAICFTGQNNLLFVGVSNLSAAAVQVLVQSKTLWAAIFSVLLLKRRFLALHWISFILLIAGVVLVQVQDANAVFASSAHAGGVLLGVIASLSAALLSGFAGVFLERTFNRKAASLWELNVHLSVLALPLQALAIFQFDGSAIHQSSLFYGFHLDTWLVVFIQAVGGLLTAVVIKYAGNMLKSFATSMSLISTSLISIAVLGYEPSGLYWAGLTLVCFSTMLYGAPPPHGWCLDRPLRTQPVDCHIAAELATNGEEADELTNCGATDELVTNGDATAVQGSPQEPKSSDSPRAKSSDSPRARRFGSMMQVALGSKSKAGRVRVATSDMLELDGVDGTSRDSSMRLPTRSHPSKPAREELPTAGFLMTSWLDLD